MTEWRFEFDAPAGERILKRFWGVTNFEGWWFDTKSKTWVQEGGNSNWDHAPRTFKAFKRYLRRHPELKNLKEVVLGSLFVGHDIRAYPNLPSTPNVG